MKGLLIVVLVLGLIVSSGGLVMALDKTASPASMSDATRDQLAAQAKNKLEGRQWEVYVTSPGKKAAAETDVFTFAEGKVTSKNLSAQGYRKSNLNVGIQDDGTAVWETMQVNANNDLVFLRGELSGNAMKGVISMQPIKGAKTLLDFTNALQQEAPLAKEAAPAAVTKKGKK
jgi:hypothetical protein